MRSGLFIPADSERKFLKGMGSGADSLFIDLEDSVALDNKVQARDTACGFLREVKNEAQRPLLFVRLNAYDTGLTDDDLGAIMADAPDGVVLPKSEHGQDVTRLDTMLRVHEAENNIDDGATDIIAIITETAIGTINAGMHVALAHPNVHVGATRFALRVCAKKLIWAKQNFLVEWN